MIKSVKREFNMKFYGNKFENWRKYWKEDEKWFIFVDDMIVNFENLKEFSKNFLELRRKLVK